MRSELPTGTVTFLFTDVEGSTSLLHELGAEAYADALTDHRRLIREASVGNGGVEVDTQGDAFFFAFPTASGALAAASKFTERLAVNGPIRVRVGLHTGTPLLSDEGYVGHDVHRAARMAAAGHGGQVLVSASTAPLVDAELTDLGEHRFRDLSAPVRVYQLGEVEFPPLKSLYRTNLPVPATPFVGRAQELRGVVELLTGEDASLVTLTGPGGSGKTRLALQAAAGASESFPDGVFWIPLAPLRDASALETTFAQALGVADRPGASMVDSIATTMADERALVVVDNCEHLVDAVAGLLGKLVELCRYAVFVASSRERLGLRVERIYDVPPMEASDGELLFVERARAAGLSDFRADEHVTTICAAMDGLPLAIELAAAHVRSLTTQAIRDRLGERLGLLASRARDVDERQRTLEATIAWSFDLLDAREQQMLRALSVFAGGCTADGALAVAGADLESLESLLDKSLIRHRVDEAGQDRYWMLETIREYASRELLHAREANGAGARHMTYFLDLAPEMLSPVGRATSDRLRARYSADRANFRVAHDRALDNGDGASAVRFVRYLGRVGYSMPGWVLRDDYAVALASLALPGGACLDRAYALVRAASCAFFLGEFDAARAFLSEAEELFEGDPVGLADANFWRCGVEIKSGNYSKAVALAEKQAVIAKALDNSDLAAWADLALSGALFGRALDGDRSAAERSRALIEEDLQSDSTRESSVQTANQLVNLALVLFMLDEHEESISAAKRSLETQLKTSRVRATDQICALGLAISSARYDLGVKLVSAALKQYSDDGIALEAWTRTVLERLESRARAALGDERYDAAIRDGQALTSDAAIELALNVNPVPDR